MLTTSAQRSPEITWTPAAWHVDIMLSNNIHNWEPGEKWWQTFEIERGPRVWRSGYTIQAGSLSTIVHQLCAPEEGSLEGACG